MAARVVPSGAKGSGKAEKLAYMRSNVDPIMVPLLEAIMAERPVSHGGARTRYPPRHATHDTTHRARYRAALHIVPRINYFNTHTTPPLPTLPH
jgi:hypothetical protein